MAVVAVNIGYAPELVPYDMLPDEPVTVVVPSKGRWDRVLVGNMLDPADFVVIVEPQEESLYRDHNPDLQIVAHPAEVSKYSKKLEWAYRTYGTVFFMDDDMSKLVHFEHAGRDPAHYLNPAEAIAVIRRAATECRQAGTFMFGFMHRDIRLFKTWKPWTLTGWIPGSGLGLLSGSSIEFNHDIGMNMDYWLSCYAVYVHRFLWKDWRYQPDGPATTFSGAVGGASAVRTSDSERRDHELLVRSFGADIVRLKKPAPQLKQAQHEYARTLWFPF